MTAPSSIDQTRFLHEQLGSASPDLLRQMLTTFMNTLMSAEADAVCGGICYAISAWAMTVTVGQAGSASSQTTRRRRGLYRMTASALGSRSPRPRARAPRSSLSSDAPMCLAQLV